MKCKLSLALGLASTLAFAQPGGIGAVKVEPSPARVGQEVKITISAEGEAPSFCGMVVHFDDGSESRNVKIDGNEGKFPHSFTRTYAKAGSYSIKAEGRKITTHFPCIGAATTRLVVEDAPVKAQAATAASCPEGYAMIGKKGKMGDFSCKGGKGATAPAKPLACGEGLEYFSGDKAKQVGCRKAKSARK
jgi:hypothetical protein